MISPTVKIKNQVRNGVISGRRAARSTVRRVSRGLAKEISKNGAISAYGTARSTVKGRPLSRSELEKIDAYWRAANYLSVGQLLYDNPLLKKPLTEVNTLNLRLLGHWGTTPGSEFHLCPFESSDQSSGTST